MHVDTIWCATREKAGFETIYYISMGENKPIAIAVCFVDPSSSYPPTT